jgi:class 3 adenylate cyclase
VLCWLGPGGAPLARPERSRQILVADIIGFSRLADAGEDCILARLRALRSNLIDPTIAVHKGRIVKRTGNRSIVEFLGEVDAVLCAIELQNSMVERNARVPEDRQIRHGFAALSSSHAAPLSPSGGAVRACREPQSVAGWARTDGPTKNVG